MASTKTKTKTNKTPYIMNLLNGTKTAVNPVIDKSFIKENVMPKEKNRIMNNYSADDREITINITSEIISEWMPKILQRFNCCTCDVCVAEASVEALEKIPAITVAVKDKTDLKKADKLKQENLTSILMSLVQIANKRKHFPKHNV